MNSPTPSSDLLMIPVRTCYHPELQRNDNGVCCDCGVHVATSPASVAEHRTLAALWCNYNAQRGTDKQTARVMKQLSVADLRRMLAERGVHLRASEVAAS